MLAGELALAGVDVAIVERRASGLGIGDSPRKTFFIAVHPVPQEEGTGGHAFRPGASYA